MLLYIELNDIQESRGIFKLTIVKVTLPNWDSIKKYILKLYRACNANDKNVMNLKEMLSFMWNARQFEMKHL